MSEHYNSMVPTWRAADNWLVGSTDYTFEQMFFQAFNSTHLIERTTSFFLSRPCTAAAQDIRALLLASQGEVGFGTSVVSTCLALRLYYLGLLTNWLWAASFERLRTTFLTASCHADRDGSADAEAPIGFQPDRNVYQAPTSCSQSAPTLFILAEPLLVQIRWFTSSWASHLSALTRHPISAWRSLGLLNYIIRMLCWMISPVGG